MKVHGVSEKKNIYLESCNEIDPNRKAESHEKNKQPDRIDRYRLI